MCTEANDADSYSEQYIRDIQLLIIVHAGVGVCDIHLQVVVAIIGPKYTGSIAIRTGTLCILHSYHAGSGPVVRVLHVDQAGLDMVKNQVSKNTIL